MLLSIIVAVSENGAIGKDNQLLWRLPDDLKRFKQLTMGSPIIMGRKTFQSIGKPLPGRTSIVISRNPNQIDGAIVVSSVEEALEAARNTGAVESFVIGGGEIYQLFLPATDKIYLTKVHTLIEGDTYFKLDESSHWKELSRTLHHSDEKHLFSFEFIDLEKIKS